MSLKGRPHKGAGILKYGDSYNDMQFATIQPLGPSKAALDVIPSAAFYVGANDRVAEAGSTSSQIVLTGHDILPGDIIRFKTVASLPIQLDMGVHEIIDANTVSLVGSLTNLAGADAPIAVADTFDILRPIAIRATASGALASGPVEFILDGNPQIVTEDTGTPANNRPLPVKLTGTDGDVVINAANLNLEVQFRHDTANYDSTQIGDGTNRVTMLPGASAAPTNVAADHAMRVSDFHVKTVLDLINAKLVDGTDIGDVTINNGGAGAAVPIQDGGNSITVDGSNFDIRELHANLSGGTFDSVRVGDANDNANVRVGATASTDLNNNGNSLYVTDHLSLQELEAINAKMVSGTDIGDVTINNGAGESIPINDAGGTLTVDDGGLSLTVDATALDIRQLIHTGGTPDSVRLGDGVQFAEVKVGNVTPTGAVGDNALYVSDFYNYTELLAIKAALSTPAFDVAARVDFSLSNVTEAAVTPIATTVAAVTKATIFVASGDPMYLTVGGANTLIIPPGGFPHPIDVIAGAGVVIGVKRVIAGTTSAGNIIINLLG